jgi:ferritin
MLSEKMEKALNEQLNAEFYSSYLYMSMANYCDENDLPGFAHWLRMQTQEEYTHANTFMTYIIDRDGHVELYQINQPDSEFKDIQDVFEKALAHEKFVTEQVNNLYAEEM